MQFKRCVCCGLELPLSVLTPIQVRTQGKIITVPICDTCKKIKEEETKRRNNENKI
jgi:hypothetical protein